MIVSPRERGRRAGRRWRRADTAWERLQEEGVARLAAGDARGAARAFRRAGWIALLALPRREPRQATTLANLALADRLAGRERRALRRYARARALWAESEGFVARMEIAHRSRSAQGDRRMQARHLETYRANMRIRMTGFTRTTATALAALEAGRPVTARLAERWAAEKPAQHDDTRRLLAAALLVAVPPAGVM